ncbi:hypothetical protein LguiA_031332 [Lonicera macranthoides]
MGKRGKYIAIAVSGILVVAVAIGVIVGVTQHNKKSGDDDEKALSSTTKSIASICSQTDYKKTCVESLSSLANNDSATPKDYFQTAIRVTIDEVKAAMEKSGTIGNASKDPAHKMAVEDCKDLLQFAVDELESSYSTVGDSSLHNMNDRAAELQNWLSAVISYQDTCIDGFIRPDWKDAMLNGMVNATQLTVNALAMVSAISDILNAFNIPVNTSSNSGGYRRLLESPRVDNNGYPAWFTSVDRKLLASNNNAGLTPNAVVAKDGSGQYSTIGAALAAYPKSNKGRYVIYIKAGIYQEYVTVTKDQTNVFIYGDGPRKTIVTGSKSMSRNGLAPFRSASFATVGSGFIAKAIGFQNTAGPEGHQAVALRSQSDMSAFYNCRMDGYQDTLYMQTHRQFYRNCVISGTVDFIFGDAAAVIQNSLIIVRKPMDNQQNTVTAQGRTQSRETTGLVIQNCRIVPELKLSPVRFQIPTYLGRPWKEYSRTIIMETTLADFIQPAGWLEWTGTFALDTLYYAEYANRGPGANTDKRVKWKGYRVITNRNEVLQFTAGPFIQGDQWLSSTGSPFILGLKN